MFCHKQQCICLTIKCKQTNQWSIYCYPSLKYMYNFYNLLTSYQYENKFQLTDEQIIFTHSQTQKLLSKPSIIYTLHYSHVTLPHDLVHIDVLLIMHNQRETNQIFFCTKQENVFQNMTFNFCINKNIAKSSNFMVFCHPIVPCDIHCSSGSTNVQTKGTFKKNSSESCRTYQCLNMI